MQTLSMAGIRRRRYQRVELVDRDAIHRAFRLQADKV